MRRHYWEGSKGTLRFSRRTYRHYCNWRQKYGWGNMDTRAMRVKFLRYRAKSLHKYHGAKARHLHR